MWNCLSPHKHLSSQKGGSVSLRFTAITLHMPGTWNPLSKCFLNTWMMEWWEVQVRSHWARPYPSKDGLTILSPLDMPGQSLFQMSGPLIAPTFVICVQLQKCAIIFPRLCNRRRIFTLQRQVTTQLWNTGCQYFHFMASNHHSFIYWAPTMCQTLS